LFLTNCDVLVGLVSRKVSNTKLELKLNKRDNQIFKEKKKKLSLSIATVNVFETHVIKKNKNPKISDRNAGMKNELNWV
jgi:hypothetical protein